MPLGQSYSPLNDEEQKNQQGAAPVQEAIRLLSLQMPSVQGAQGIAPQALLQGQGSGGMDMASLLALLRRLAAGGAGQAAPGAGSPYPPNPWQDFPKPGGPVGPVVTPTNPAPPPTTPKPNIDFQPLPVGPKPWDPFDSPNPLENTRPRQERV